MNKILLVRHGQSIGNASGIIQGKSNFKLSGTGRSDVKKLVRENKKLFNQYDSLVSSTLNRARETAIIISDELDKKITFDTLLEEFDVGILEGLKKADVKEIYPEYYKVWKKRGDLDTIPGAEKGDILQARVLMYLEKYLNSDSKEIIVSHAGFIRSLINTVYGRSRTTPVLLNHNNIYCLENVWNNIGLNECTIAKNSKVYEVDTYDKKYIMKRVTKRGIEDAEKEKELLKYLSKSIYTPQIIGLAEKDNYVLKVMDYAFGENVRTTLNKEKINNTTTELYKLKQLLKDYENFDKYEESNVIETLKSLLQTIEDSDVRKIMLNMLHSEKFNNGLKEDNIQVVHDDLHRDNILYQYNKPVFLDFEGLKKWPSTYQLASHIAANYLLYDDSFNIDLILNNWPEKIESEYLKGLIIFRLIQGYNYFSNRVKTKECSIDDYEFQKIYKKSLKKIADWKE